MLLTQATFYVLIIIGDIVTAFTPECGPRDVVAARRTCNRACLHDGTCRKKNRECVCDGLCGLSCLRKRCPILTAPLNGNMIVNPIDRTIGAEVSYSCNDGYVISGQTNRICQSTKTWSGTEPTCTDSTTEGPRQECAERNEVAAGRNCGKACQPDGTCKKGNRECVCDGLCGLTCLKKIPCPLLELSDGILEYRDGNDRIIEQPNHRDIRTATCSEGYVLSGTSQTICFNGVWQDELPSCQRVPCPILDLEDGALAYLDKSNQRVFEPHHGDIRVAVCKDGSSLLGTSQTRCISGSWQDELPSCEVGLCNMNDLPSGDWNIVYDYPGRRDESAEVMKPPGTVARFTCNEIGYVTVGQSTRTCRQGEWDGQNPSCERSRCPVSQLEDGRLRYYDSDGTLILIPRHGDIRMATCNEGYSLEGTSRTQCLEGEWMEELPTCQENPCSLLTETDVPDYLQVTYTAARAQGSRTISSSGDSVPSRGVATFSCREEGFVLRGESQRTCKKGTWRGAFPECVIAHCSVATIINGGVTRDNGDPFIQEASHGDRIRFTCDEGYTLAGDEISQCDAGEWIPEIPTCVEAPCPAVVNNGEYARILYFGRPSDAQSFPSNTGLEVDCAEGRVPEGPSLSFCRKGFWDPPKLLCVLTAPCQDVPAEDGRTIVYTDNTGNQKQHNSNLTVTCEGRMVRFGQNRSTCVNGAWSPPVAHCKENHALWKQTNQDTTVFNGDADKAVDGNTNGSYFTAGSCSHTSNDDWIHWWYVDLGSSVLVQNIVIYNRQDRGLHTRLLNAKVRVGNRTGQNVIQNHLVGTVDDTTSNPILIEVNTATSGRIVSVSELNPRTPLSLCEVQVFGELLGCSDGCEVPLLVNGYFTRHSVRAHTPLPPKTCVLWGQHIYAQCREGLTLEGSYYYTCQRSGEWDKPRLGDATCQLCQSRQCVVPHIENGHYSARRDGTPLEEGSCLADRRFLYVVCHDGMQLHGSSFYSCNGGELLTRNDDNVLSSCSRDVSNEQERSCSSPGVFNLVDTFVGSDYKPFNGQETFSEGDFLTSRCQDAKSQQFQGSVTRRCERGQWSGDRPRCESTDFVISVSNTVLQNVTENGTIIVFPVSGYVSINCKLQRNNLRRTISMYKNNEEISSYRDRTEFNLRRSRINNPSEAHSGTYTCESNGQSLSIVIIFKAIRCPHPEVPNIGSWRHHRAGANARGHLGFIFMETVSLSCPRDYRASDTTRAQCSYHGTWINLSQTCIRYRFS